MTSTAGILGLQLLITALVFIGVFAITLTLPAAMARYRSRFSAQADRESHTMNLATNTSLLFVINLVLACATPIVLQLSFDIWWLSLAGFVGALLFPLFIWPTLRKRRLRKIENQLPDTFISLANTLQSGASINNAFVELANQTPAPLKGELKWLVRRMRLGASLDDALQMLEQRIPSPSFVMASSAIRISREVGGNLVTTISAMASTLRRKAVMEGKIDSLTAQGRAQGRFMSAMPIVIAVGLFYLEPEAMEKLYTTTMGLLVLGGMVVMQICGVLFIKRITSIDS